ncbi:MAG: sulfite exporter TauE/SafE family protein [Candidatus Cloacimonadota bacterium]|nr:sulfite exporter TauE/SafE family protein [Candidatus Cloacimonadota bacterium]
MNVTQLILGFLIFFSAAMLQGITGFGFSLLAVPLLTFFLPPKIVIPIMLLLSIPLNIAVIFSHLKSVNFRKISLILFAGIIGMPIGTYFLVNVNDWIIKLGIGLLIITFGGLLLLGFQKKFKHEKITRLIIGFASGILGGAVSMSGPPIVLFLANNQERKNTFRVNLALYYFCLNLFIIPIYVLNNLLTPQVFSLSLTFLPALILGVIFGNLFAKKLPENTFRKITLILLLIMGFMAVISSFKIG